jgi:glycosyltransferase involved in cell wall biosynthesis
MPGVYQHYLLALLDAVKKCFQVKTLVYDSTSKADFSINSSGLKERIYRKLYSLKLVGSKSLDLKVMQQFDIVHVQHSYLWRKLLPLKGLRNRPKIILTLRGGDTYLKPWSYITLAQFYKDSSALIDAFVVMSAHQKKYLERWGVSEDKIHVIPISFGEKSNASPKYPKKDILRLVSAFRMTWEKNIEGHIKFAKSIKDKGVPFRYDIYGNGNDIDQLYFLIDKYNLGNEVSVMGKVENPALKDALINYDMFVQLSITESLGMSVIEAQAAGLPCIVSSSGGLPEVVVNNKTGIVDDYNNIDDLAEECIKLWKNHERYNSFSKNAISYVNSKFTIQNELESLQLLHNKLYNS